MSWGNFSSCVGWKSVEQGSTGGEVGGEAAEAGKLPARAIY